MANMSCLLLKDTSLLTKLNPVDKSFTSWWLHWKL